MQYQGQLHYHRSILFVLTCGNAVCIVFQMVGKKRVAVIGAGPAGLVSARYLSARSQDFECHVFERENDVGGTWRISEHIGTDSRGLQVHSSMYKNLRTNLPKEIMLFPDFTVPNVSESYVSSELVLQYLENYTKHFHLRPLIHFNHLVTNVKPISTTNEWELEVIDLSTKSTKKYIFDSVMVCNGRYSKPHIPQMIGASEFKGQQLHSHDYREPVLFKGQRILVIGASASARDLTIDISNYGKEVKVVLSHHSTALSMQQLPECVRQVPDVERITSHGAVFKNGIYTDLDTILYCTGYEFSYPFLHESCGARYFLRILDNSMQLPSSELMRAITEHELQQRRAEGLVGTRLAHTLGPERQQAYCDGLAQEAGIPSIPRVVTALHATNKQMMLEKLADYRNACYRVVDNETFERVNIQCEEVTFSMAAKKRVAVIGAGPAGLIAARHLSARPQDFECHVFEREEDVGGTTNLPMKLMAFPDFPAPDTSESYVEGALVLKYLEAYTEHFKLRPFIHFNHLVTCVRPVAEDIWEVEVIDLVTKIKKKDMFHGIFVCNGHFSEPIMPQIDGASKFGGQIIHSHDYRVPEKFMGQRVLVIGAGPSALDIALELAECAKQVIISHHDSEAIKTEMLPETVREVPDVVHFIDRGTKLKNDVEIHDLDAIIFCTGTFPFLHASCGVRVTERGVEPLYRHLIHIERPSMCFLGLPNHIVPFPLADLQVRYFLRFFDGSKLLPTVAEMKIKTDRELEQRRYEGLIGSRLAHFMGPKQRAYYDLLAEEAEIDPILPSMPAESLRCIVSSRCTQKSTCDKTN
ncbi:hypothetical protein B566_EDAN006557 [Ephemera danica]|nr:hypothetical protein B566_EDAN006557 [Ephemera danica]